MEFFMIKTGFYSIVTKKEAYRLLEEEAPYEPSQIKKELAERYKKYKESEK